MDWIDGFKTYTFCVYIFFTMCFWFFLIAFIHKRYRADSGTFIGIILFFIVSFLVVPIIWPIMGANYMIKRLAEGK